MGARMSCLGPIAAYVLLGIAWLQAVPPWESPDEPQHLAYAEALAEGRLPSPEENYEAHQPPLYYLWVAGVLRVGRLGVIARSSPNPRLPYARAACLHPPDDPSVAPLRLVRAASSLIGIVTLALVWATARAAMPGSWRRPAAATLLVGLLPQFQFSTHAVTNDTMAAAAGALAAYLLIAWAAGRRGHRRTAVGLSAAAVAAGLAKGNTLPILASALPIAAVRAALPHPGRSGSGARSRVLVVPAAGAAALAATAAAARALAPGPFDHAVAALAQRAMYVRPEQWGTWQVAGVLRATLRSLWGNLGWLTIPLPEATVAAVAGCLAVAVALLDLPRRPRRVRAAAAAAAIVVAVAVAAHLKSAMADPQAQGRLLFPALAAMALLVTVGASALVPPRARTTALAALCLLLLAANLHATKVVLPRAFGDVSGPMPDVDQRLVPPRRGVAYVGMPGRGRAEQTFRAGRDGLVRVEVAVAEVVGSGRLTLTLLDDGGRVVARGSHALVDLRHSAWVSLDLPAQADSGGRTWRLRLEVQAERPNAGAVAWVAARTSDRDRYTEGRLDLGGAEGTDLVLISYVAAPSAAR